MPLIEYEFWSWNERITFLANKSRKKDGKKMLKNWCNHTISALEWNGMEWLDAELINHSKLVGTAPFLIVTDILIAQKYAVWLWGSYAN